ILLSHLGGRCCANGSACAAFFQHCSRPRISKGTVGCRAVCYRALLTHSHTHTHTETVYTHTDTNIHITTHTHTHTNTNINICHTLTQNTHTHTHTHTSQTYTHTHTHTHTHRHTHTQTEGVRELQGLEQSQGNMALTALSLLTCKYITVF